MEVQKIPAAVQPKDVRIHRCDKLLILGYISVQEVDSKMGQLIYLLCKVILELNLQNKQISTGKRHENSKNSKNKHFKVALLTD